MDALGEELERTKSLYARQMEKGQKHRTNEQNEITKREAAESQLQTAERMKKLL